MQKDKTQKLSRVLNKSNGLKSKIILNLQKFLKQKENYNLFKQSLLFKNLILINVTVGYMCIVVKQTLLKLKMAT